MKVDRVHEAIYRIAAPFGNGGTVFLYLLKGKRLALVDTGTGRSPQTVIQPALESLGMDLSQVDLILNTHCHLDHTGGNLAIRKVSDAAIYLHRADLSLSRSVEAQVEFLTARLRALDVPKVIQQQPARLLASMAGGTAGVDVRLLDGDRINLGDGVELRAIHCPGHTPGSTCYYWESEGVLLAGDAVQGTHPFYCNASAYRHSLATLTRFQTQLLCLGHTHPGGRAAEDPTVRGVEACGQLLQEAMQSADSLHGIVAEVVKEKPRAARGAVALEAFARMSAQLYHIPSEVAIQMGMPWSAAITLLAHIEAALEGNYPV